jgi:hypothetical protein
MNRHVSRMRWAARIVLVAAVAALVLIAASAVAASGNYTDPTGDGRGAPDITNVTVASDAAGTIVFHISVVDLPSPADVRTFLFLDTDVNPATGSLAAGGAEYFFVVDESDNSFDFARWTGSSWDDDIPYSTVHISSGRSGVTVVVNRSELGDTSGFNFWTRTRAGDVSADQADTAPDSGVWNYSLAAAGPDITSVLVTSAPSFGPKAGKPFTVTPIGLRLPAGPDPISILPHPDSYTCTAKLGGQALRGRGTGGCTWSLPKKARGKTLSVTLTVSYQGATKTVPFVYRVT